MGDHEGSEPRDPQIPGELFRSTAGTPAFDLAEALGGLDRATRNFARKLGEDRDPELEETISQRFSAATGVDSEPAHGQLGDAAETAEAAEPADQAPKEPRMSAREAFDARMLQAEREAREYLEHAKRRADSLVTTMVGAVEKEAVEMRRDAEAGIQARRREIEMDAERHVAEGRSVAERMVAERQQRISALSDGITGRAKALTAGMDDADRVQAQFDSFVRSLSATADQIAGGGELVSRRRAAGGRDDQDRPSAIAA